MSTRHAGKAIGDATHERHGVADPAPEASMSRDVINIPDNVLIKGAAQYAQQDQDDLQWLFSYATAELDGSRSRLCELVGCDWTTLFRVATGTYPASIENIMVKVRDVKRRVTESAGTSGFIPTLVTLRIHETLDYALAGDIDGGKIVLVIGASRRGKTKAIKEWARSNNHGRSVYVDCPESGGMREFLYEIADALRINKGRRTADLKQRIIESFNPRRILIVDEVARLLSSGRDIKLDQLEFIRRLHDKTGCAIALCATQVFEEMLDTQKYQRFLEQLLGRIAEPLRIPDRVYKEEIRSIRAGIGADSDPQLLDLAHAIANKPGKLGVLFELLSQAARVAQRRKSPLAHEHLAAAWKRRQLRFAWPEKDA